MQSLIGYCIIPNFGSNEIEEMTNQSDHLPTLHKGHIKIREKGLLL